MSSLVPTGALVPDTTVVVVLAAPLVSVAAVVDPSSSRTNRTTTTAVATTAMSTTTVTRIGSKPRRRTSDTTRRYRVAKRGRRPSTGVLEAERRAFLRLTGTFSVPVSVEHGIGRGSGRASLRSAFRQAHGAFGQSEAVDLLTQVDQLGPGPRPMKVLHRRQHLAVGIQCRDPAEQERQLAVALQRRRQPARVRHFHVPVSRGRGDLLEVLVAGQYRAGRLGAPSLESGEAVGAVADQREVVRYGLGVDAELGPHAVGVGGDATAPIELHDLPADALPEILVRRADHHLVHGRIRGRHP